MSKSSIAERPVLELSERLRSRRYEIEQAVLTRVYAVSDSAQTADPLYVEGSRTAVAVALDYGLLGLEQGEEWTPPIPAPLLAQARIAARSRISLDTVLRRYFAGYAVLSDFVIGEVREGGLLKGSSMQRVLRTQATLFDRLLAAVSDEYRREAGRRPQTPQQRRTQLVERLLSGELLDTAGLAYDFAAWHVGIVILGTGSPDALRDPASQLDSRLLLVPRDGGMAWAWLGCRARIDARELERLVLPIVDSETSIAVGESCRGLAGWRLTHRQARAALPIAASERPRFTRYSDVALLAAVLQDETLAISLRQMYLAPLTEERDGGHVARQTLRAYFAADRNVSSAAAVLGTSRRTVTNRLRAIEEKLDCPLGTMGSELEAALRMDELHRGRDPYSLEGGERFS
jgi:hypothetical protein